MLNMDEAPLSIAQRLDIIQSNDTGALQELVDQALAKYPEKITEYKNGKTNLLGLFVGEVMKMGKGKADPKMANQLVKEALDKH
jgi:aspartyl-tRNA(Asn)/glutamyl-tRNA(Gln) amidotransferase subunit B